MKGIFLALIATSLVAVPARAQGAKPSDIPTPEYGEGLAKGKPLCQLPPVPKAATGRAESLVGAGTIILPAGFIAEPQERPTSKRWMGDDSATFTVLVGPRAMGGMAHSGGGDATFESAPPCVISVDGHHAVVERVKVVMQTDSIYLATIPVFVKPGKIVNASIEAPSAARRDELISRFAASSIAH